MRKQIVALVAVFCTLAVTLTGMPEAAAHHKNEQKVEKILYIPHDNRPISDKQTAEVISKLGYEVVVPPDNMLGSPGHFAILLRELRCRCFADGAFIICRKLFTFIYITANAAYPLCHSISSCFLLSLRQFLHVP